MEQADLFSAFETMPDQPHEGVTPGPLVVATDGSCLRNPGPGGWCWYAGDDCWAAGAEADTTNNRMELLAVAMLLETVPLERAVHIQADSSYVIDALTKWRHGWKRRGWRTSSGEPVKNRDLMERLDALVSDRTPTFEWVRGHAGHPANEAADERARRAATAIAAGRAWESGPGMLG